MRQQFYTCIFVKLFHMVWWVWMWFTMYLHWNRTSQSHRIGMEPIHVWHHTQVCITSKANRTMWTVSLTTTQSNFCILKIAVVHRTVWTSSQCCGLMPVAVHWFRTRCDFVLIQFDSNLNVWLNFSSVNSSYSIPFDLKNSNKMSIKSISLK